MRDAASQLASAPPGEVFYPRLVRRVRAYLIDQVVLLAIALAWLLLLRWMDGFTPAQKIFALIAPMLLAEPCLVSLTGGTIGHHLMRLRICDARTDRNLGFVRATLRAVLRLMLGWLSALFILMTRRRQALHDVLLGSVVVVSRAEHLPAYELLAALPFELERAPGMPSKLRRSMFVLLYVLAASITVGVVAAALISPQCTSTEVCTRQEEIIQTVCGGTWLAAVAAVLVLGIRGRLWGARRKADAASGDTQHTGTESTEQTETQPTEHGGY